MSETAQILAVIKRELRARGLTYRDVAATLRLSEASVKRLLSRGRLTLERVSRLARLVDMTLAELAQAAAVSEPRLQRLTIAQEAELVADRRLLLVAVLTLNHWGVEDIVATYRLGKPECIRYLLRLDRLRLIDLLPGDRARPNVARDFDWLPGGPIQRFFRAHLQGDFLSGQFDQPQEVQGLVHGMLSAPAVDDIERQLRRVRERFAELHRESLARPRAERRGVALLFAMRPWEPQAFAALRR
jgi:hypothetical protein